MDYYELDLDEAIIIQSSNVTRDGYDESEFEDEYLREIILTNKRIMYVVAPDDEADGEDCDIIAVPLNAVKVINGQAQVKQVEHDLYNLCLQIQFVHGVEYWRFGVKAKQQIPVWVSKISDAVHDLPEDCEYTYEKPQMNRNPQNQQTGSTDIGFCLDCGASLSRSTKFCPECGAKVGQSSPPPGAQADVVYDGKIHKCKNCGEVLKAFETVCPSCGYELRDVYASATVRAFAEKMEELQKNSNYSTKGKIINLIRTFPIPNTKEDLFEFIILAGSNIREDRYNSELPKYKREISDAWNAKFEQAYNKARVAFGDDPDFLQLKEIYISKRKEIRSNRKSGFFNNVAAETKELLGIITLFLIIGIVVASVFSIDSRKIEAENDRLNAIVEEVYVCIEQEQYALARSKAATLVFSGSTTQAGEQAAAKWDVTRSQLLNVIDKSEHGDNYVSTPREIRVGSSHDDFLNDDYQEVREKLTNLGFTNIKTEPIKDWTTGWWNEEGSVEKISINGDVVFSEDSTYMSDAEIIIHYRANNS